MADMGIDDANEHVNKLFPEGKFRFHISRCEIRDAKDNKGQDAVFELQVLDGRHKNEKKQFYFAIVRHATDDKSRKTVEAGKANISKISLACGVQQPDTKTLFGKNFIGEIKHKEGWANLGKCEKDTGPDLKPDEKPATKHADSESTMSKPAGW